MTQAAKRAVEAKGQRTRETILDAAEELFGQSNFDAVSFRHVAERSGLLLGIVSYHFKTKEMLFEAVASRRAEETNHIRIAELSQYAAPTVEQILDAFIRPILVRSLQPGWRNYVHIVAQISHEERWADMNARLFRPTAQIFYQAMRRALPDAPEELLARAFVYMVFVFLGAMQENAKLRDLSDAYAPDDAEKVLATVLPFVTSGFLAVVGAKL